MWTGIDCDASPLAFGAANSSAGDAEAAYKPDVDSGNGHLCRMLASSQRHSSHPGLL